MLYEYLDVYILVKHINDKTIHIHFDCRNKSLLCNYNGLNIVMH